MMKRISLLILALCSLGLHAQTCKLSPNLSALLQRAPLTSSLFPSPSSLLPPASPETFRATIVADDAEAAAIALADAGIDATVITPTILNATLRLPVAAAASDLDVVAAIPGVERIELGAPAKPVLSRARQDVGISTVHNGNPKYNVLGQSFMGDGVIVGIVDTGFEYGHAAFYDKEGRLRISRVWEQDIAYGRHPKQFNYGTELLTETEILNAETDDAAGTHGTHVAGCAAGSDFGTDYYGMAPNAELVLVAINEYSSSPRILDGVKYIFDYAESVGKPCVVNLSLGSHQGPHDGTSTFDQAIDALTGPGRIVVGAVGNEGDYRLHVSKTFADDDTTLKTMYGFTSSAVMESQIDVWGDVDETYSVAIVVADNLKGQIRYTSDAVASDSPTPLKVFLNSTEHGVTGYVTITPDVNAANGRHNVFVETHLTAKQTNRAMGLLITGKAGTTVHAWNCYGNDFVSNGRTGWTGGDSDYTAGELGGTGRNTISVGAYQLRSTYTDLCGDTYIMKGISYTVGDIPTFTSCGPTLDGRTKPEVLAPGVLVCGPVSRLYYGYDARYNMEALSEGPTGTQHYYYPMSGTSMAAPIVTGSIACWLQAAPQLTPADCRYILQCSSRLDYFASTAPVNAVGFGKLDAYNGLLQAANGVAPDGVDVPLRANDDTDNGRDNALYDLQGRRVVPTAHKGLHIAGKRKILR